MGRKGDDRLYQFVDDMVSTGAQELMLNLGLEEALARDLMRNIAHSICLQYARSYMYVPVDMEFELSARDKDIWRKYQEDSPKARKFTSARIDELACEYLISTVQVYCILRLMKSRERALRVKEFAERQGVLPGLEPESLAAERAALED